MTLLLDAILALVALEALVFVLRRRLDLLINLLAGAFLMVALRLVLSGVDGIPLLACLLGAGLSHGADLWTRAAVTRP